MGWAFWVIFIARVCFGQQRVTHSTNTSCVMQIREILVICRSTGPINLQVCDLRTLLRATLAFFAAPTPFVISQYSAAGQAGVGVVRCSYKAGALALEMKINNNARVPNHARRKKNNETKAAERRSAQQPQSDRV